MYDLRNVQCLALPSYAFGACRDVAVSQIGVVAGFGPCQFVGLNGLKLSVSGGAGYHQVSPPQNIVSASCG